MDFSTLLFLAEETANLSIGIGLGGVGAGLAAVGGFAAFASQQ